MNLLKTVSISLFFIGFAAGQTPVIGEAEEALAQARRALAQGDRPAPSTLRAQGHLRRFQDGETPGTILWTIASPRRFRLDAEIEVFSGRASVRLSKANDDGVFWTSAELIQSGGAQAQSGSMTTRKRSVDKTEEMRAALTFQADFLRFWTAWTMEESPDVSLHSSGREGEVEWLLFRHAEGREFRLELDASTHLPQAMTYRGSPVAWLRTSRFSTADASSSEGTAAGPGSQSDLLSDSAVRIEFGAYEPFGGRMLPTEVKTYLDDRLVETASFEFKVDIPVDPGEFKKAGEDGGNGG